MTSAKTNVAGQTSASSAERADGPKIATWQVAGPALLAPRRGVLSVSDGCLVIASGGEQSLPILPQGDFSWDAKLGALVSKGQWYRVNEEIVFYGGAAKSITEEFQGRQFNIPPCAVKKGFLVFRVGI